jgi:hypothetical protein
MDEHLGASIPLSFGLVIVFAIVLYQPDEIPLPRGGPDVSASKPQRARTAPSSPLPELTPEEPLVRRSAAAATDAEASAMRPIPAADARGDRIASVPLPSASKTPVRRSIPVLPPCEGFAQALDGETLRDVAIRLYGSADETEAIWRLNRDLIRRREGILPAGTLLRTP